MLRVTVGAILILTSIASARDLAVISVNSHAQAKAATEILGGANGAVDDRYLVIIDEIQTARLEAAGITPRVLKLDCDPGEYTLAYATQRVNISEFAAMLPSDAVALGDGVSLISAQSVTEDEKARCVDLEEKSIPIIYRPRVQAVLPQLEDYPTDSLALLVDHDSVLSYVLRLEAFYTRYYASDSIPLVVDWLVNKFSSWGYTDVTTPPFQYAGGTYENVKAVKLGYAEPEKIILISAHLDSYNSSSGQVFAPGADDDASGTAAVLELARILKDIPLRKTVIFMPFNVEEPWMKGSFPAAQDFYNAGAQIEVMLNYDMIAYVNDSYLDIGIAGGPNHAYAELHAACGNRVSPLHAIPDNNYNGNGDHWPFHLLGYPIVRVYESDIPQNWTYHTGSDVMANMNAYYMSEAVRMAAATVGYIAAAGSPDIASDIIDAGDGQSVRIRRTAGDPSCTYYVRYGTTSGVYTDSLTIAGDDTLAIVTGLSEGITYYFTIIAIPPGGYPSIYAIESSQTPLVIPRQPTGLSSMSETTGVALQWGASREADIASYSIYRRPANLGEYGRLATGIIGTEYMDTTVLSQIGYEYRIAALDIDGNESEWSTSVIGYRATFDGGPFLVDEFTSENVYLPSQEEQVEWFDSLFDQTPYLVQSLDSVKYKLDQVVAGRSSSLFWIDDDNHTKLMADNCQRLDWYLRNQVNALVAGWRTLWFYCPTSVIPDSHLIRRELGVVRQTLPPWPDFIGAAGENGWPSVAVDPVKGLNRLADVAVLEPAEGSTVIYRYNSAEDDSTYEGKPCGLLMDGPRGKRVVLGFPLWYLSDASARALIQQALVEFGETEVKAVNGDIDLSGTVDIGDVTVLIDHLFISYQPLPVQSRADVDGSCTVDVSDLTLLLRYLFLNGIPPLPGCDP